MTLAVTGATGQLGRLVIKELANFPSSKEVIALTRSPEKGADLGAELRRFDYDEPDSLAPALAGVDTLLLISGSDIGRRVPQHEAVIDAAKSAEVGHIVYTSVLHADTSTLGLAPEHVATEAALKASGISHTILRNGGYTENYTMGLPAAIEHKALIGAAGAGRVSSATREDYALAAATVLTNKELQGKTYELAGDESYTLTELAAALSKQIGESVPYINMSQADYAAALTKAELPEDLAGFLAHCDDEASRDVLFDDSKQLSKLIGRSTTALETAIANTLS